MKITPLELLLLAILMIYSGACAWPIPMSSSFYWMLVFFTFVAGWNLTSFARWLERKFGI